MHVHMHMLAMDVMEALLFRMVGKHNQGETSIRQVMIVPHEIQSTTCIKYI